MNPKKVLDITTILGGIARSSATEKLFGKHAKSPFVKAFTSDKIQQSPPEDPREEVKDIPTIATIHPEKFPPKTKPKGSFGNTCYACQGECTSESLRLMCGHPYHHYCIKAWFDANISSGIYVTCPVCREVILEEEFALINRMKPFT